MCHMPMRAATARCAAQRKVKINTKVEALNLKDKSHLSHKCEQRKSKCESTDLRCEWNYNKNNNCCEVVCTCLTIKEVQEIVNSEVKRIQQHPEEEVLRHVQQHRHSCRPQPRLVWESFSPGSLNISMKFHTMMLTKITTGLRWLGTREGLLHHSRRFL